ncbi:MAG: large subunit ribosomal protein L10 [Patescibacteria group bacterium]|jgi:large subunit ribosomal protein L10
MVKNNSVSDAKTASLKKISDNLKSHSTLMVVSLNGLPSRQYQEIKKNLRDKGKIIVSKKSLLRRAMDEAKVEGLDKIIPFITDATALLYTNHDAFEISGILAREKSPSKAKAGQIAPMDIEVKAGPTQLVPGPDISALSAVGLIPKVEGGKISVLQDKVIVKEGGLITQAHASIMAKLDIIPFEVGITPVAAFMEGKVYDDIIIDIDAMVTDLEYAFSRALPFAVEVGYVNDQTLDFVIAKAAIHGTAIETLINENADAPVEEEKAQEPAEETKKEDSTESKSEEAPAQGEESN